MLLNTKTAHTLCKAGDMYRKIKISVEYVAYDTKLRQNSSIYVGPIRYIIVYDVYFKSVSLASFIHQSRSIRSCDHTGEPFAVCIYEYTDIVSMIISTSDLAFIEYWYDTLKVNA